MNKTVNHLKNYRPLYFAIGFTLVFVLYISLVLVPFSSCYRLYVGSNSLGLSFYYTKDMVKSFFELRNLDQLICYSEFLKIWDIIFAAVYTTMYASWIALLLKNKHLYLIIPILAMICDWSENYLEILIIMTEIEW